MQNFTDVLSGLVPKGLIKDILRSAYYLFYYNKKHTKQNGFCVYYKKGHYEFAFPNHVRFKCYEKIIDGLRITLPGFLMEYDIRKGDVIVDCGAYVGEFALYAAKAVGEEGRVIAFEPNPDACKKLASNISLNKLTNVILIEKGVWSKADKLRFFGENKGGTLFADNMDYNNASYDVIVTSLDDELEKLGVTKVDFIKMDVEGAEIEALKGSRRTLTEHNAHVAIASYHNIEGQKTYIASEKILRNFGYKTETKYPIHLTTYGQRT